MMIWKHRNPLSKIMALLTIARRLRLHNPHSLIRFSPSLHYEFISSAKPCALLSLSQAFHQTSSIHGKHTPHFAPLPHPYGQRSYQLIDFAEHVEDVQLGLHEILERVQKAKDFASGDEAVAFLDDSGVKPDKDFIFSLIWALREEWKLAFLVFKWGERWDCVVERTWCLMIWLLGNHHKFSTAWTLIHELSHASKDTQQAMLIMIDR